MNRLSQTLIRSAATIILVIAAALAAIWMWNHYERSPWTRDGRVRADVVRVTPDISGLVTSVAVRDNQRVKAGDLLFRIDPEPYKLQIAQANAAIAGAQANVTALSNSSDLSGADISAAREDIAFAQSDFERNDALYKRGFVTKADHDAAQHRVNQAKEALRQALARQEAARAKLATGSAVPGENPQVAAAQAEKAVAELSLSRTEVRAPSAGRIAQADRLQLGQQVVQGLPVLTLVGDGTSYIEANFKETDLADMQVGQPAEVHFDAYPGLKLRGHVESIGAGTGNEFSVIPAQNATGNWVKVTQRVPVRIAIDEKSARPLIAGLSTEVTVFTDGKKH